ncbi:MAG TPA: nitrate ABC transporter permease [Actinobacteria bacterium]|nr:nitrate ABC transporter permease [Actinomycetota bacterium]HCK79089.1 nitrate ABC transporter permease [Actinomycetota bacterium]
MNSAADPEGRRTAPAQPWSRFFLPVIAVLAFLLLWECYARLVNPGPTVLPPLSQVVAAGWGDRINLASSLWPTVVEVGVGFAVSVTLAFLLSLVIQLIPSVRRAVLPLLIGSQTVPLVVLAPLFVVWFGFGLLPKVLLIALVTFFPIVVALLDGYASADRESVTVLQTMGANRWQEYRLLRLPGALPALFTGIRISITYAVVAAVFAEYAGAERGLGVYLQGASKSFRTDLVLAGVLVSAVITVVLFVVVTAVERACLPWHAGVKAVTP